MRVVVDTNVLVSAVLTKGKPRATLSHIMRFHTIVCSAPVLREYRRVLLSTEFDLYVSKEKRIALLVTLGGTEIVRIGKPRLVSRDPDDDVFVETARTGNADVLVTGNSDILSMRPLSDLVILTPAEFVSRFL